MAIPTSRAITNAILTLILIVPVLMAALIVTGDAGRSGEDGAPARSGDSISQTGIIVDGYQTDKLWAMVFVQNQEYIEAHSATPGDTRLYWFREVANSFAIKLDGTVQSSGPVKRSLVELFTATDCVYCPGAEESLNVTANDMHPQNMTLIEWHRALEPGADPFETGSSGNRFNLYNVSGTPMVIFDGQLGLVGGAASARPPQFVSVYNEAISIMNTEEPMVSFTGSGKVTGNSLDFDIGFEQTAPMPRGSWSYSVVICEDLQKLHKEAMLRHTQRLSYGKPLPLLQADHPTMDLDVPGTFEGMDMQRVRENVTLKWTASDPQDGSSVLIDVQIREPGEPWEDIASDLPNTGSYVWDTMSPRYPDGNYQLRLVASDGDGNRIRSSEMPEFRLDNKDVPVGGLLFPLGGESLSGPQQVSWTSADDEDDLLRVRVSISNDTGQTWKVLTYDPDHDDYVVDSGSFMLNTLFYDDLPSYILEIKVKDKDGMGFTLRSGEFEIYNNDAPTLSLLRPNVRELFSGNIVVSYRAEDQEDGPEALNGVVKVRRSNVQSEIVLMDRPLNESADVLMFPTSILSGDGDYVLTFNVTDSRGLKATDQVELSVYDPDAPVMTHLRARANLTRLRTPFIPLEWAATDADRNEQLTFSIHFADAASSDNWTLMVPDIKGTSYNLSIEPWVEGTYWLRVEAKDSSPQRLTGDMVLGPIVYDPFDPPEVHFLFPEPGFIGTLEGTAELDLARGAFIRTVRWEGTDRDGDDLTYGLYFKGSSEQSWRPLITQTGSTTYDWNMTTLKNGSYQLRLTVLDDSERHMTGEDVVGPFTVRNPFDVPLPPVDDDTDPDDDLPDEDGSDDLLMIGLIIGSLLIVIIITATVLYIVFRPQKKEYKVMPEEGTLDLEIPDIERPAHKPMIGYSMTPQGVVMEELPAAAAPAQPTLQAPEIGGQLPPPSVMPQPAAMLSGNVSWEEVPEGQPPSPAEVQVTEPPQEGKALEPGPSSPQ